MDSKLTNDIRENFSNNEVLRVIDLALRRVVDNGENEYSPQEQRMFEKLREIKQIYGAGKLG